MNTETHRPEDFLPTRQSLLSRLKSWDEQDSWRVFFDTYWRLIFDAAVRAGLDESAAQDVVQDTIITVAKQMPGFKYDRSQGSFKGWLLLITKRRVADALRKRYRQGEAVRVDLEDPAVASELAELPEAKSQELEAHWDMEWDTHMRTAALERLKRRVKPEQFQMFDLYVLKGWPVSKVANALGVSRMQVYLSRHRLGKLLKTEMETVRAQAE